MRKFTALIASLLIVCLPLKGWAQASMGTFDSITNVKSAVVSADHGFSAIEKVAEMVADVTPAKHPCHVASADAEPNSDTQSTCNACAVCHTTGAVAANLAMPTPGFSVSPTSVAAAYTFTSAELSLALRPPAAI